MNQDLERQTRSETLLAWAEARKRITVRELVTMWGARGRGSQVVESIENELIALRLKVEPSLKYGGLDSVVQILQVGEEESTDRSPEVEKGAAEATEGVSQLALGQIPSSRASLVTAASTQSVGAVQTMMVRYDYSQLPVVDDGVLVGVISWESIAHAALTGEIKSVSQCTREAKAMKLTDDLLRSISSIIDSGYVLVLNDDQTLSGIITTADLALQFDMLARPFLVMGECERELRRVLDSQFSESELTASSRYARKNGTSGAVSMTMGDIMAFLGRDENWDRLGWGIPKQDFVDWLDEVRQLRNEIAHFNQDDEEIRPRLAQVAQLITWLKSV